MPKRLQILILISVLTVVALGLARSAPSVPPPQPTGSCSPGPADCYAWHTSNVTLRWSAPPPNVVVASGCGTVTISSDTGGQAASCTWKNASTPETSSATIVIRRDATPPSVRGAATRGPDANDWYRQPLTVQFSGTDALSGINGCSSATYSGPDSATAGISGTCKDFAGNTGSTTYTVKYDATPPTAEAKADRKPDANGWYNHAVKVAFVGTDAVSGIESCAAPVEYKGPDTEKTSLSGTCRDKAANTSQPAALELRYDTKPPSLKRVRAEIARRGVVLRWAASKDSLTFAVVRRPGLRGPKPSTIYSGKARTFIDRRLQNGVRYRYTVTAYDEAGNGAAKVLLAHPKSVKTAAAPSPTTPKRTVPSLTAPAAGAKLSLPPLLRWTAVPNATYYNVQLYRDGKKILTAWPKDTKFRLPTSWKYGGRSHVLSPGRYRWYVWPGFGSPSASDYGKLVGTRSFVFVRP
jgi:hypothetical protein